VNVQQTVGQDLRTISVVSSWLSASIYTSNHAFLRVRFFGQFSIDADQF